MPANASLALIGRGTTKGSTPFVGNVGSDDLEANRLRDTGPPMYGTSGCCRTRQ
jgi:hypothetical protein